MNESELNRIIDDAIHIHIPQDLEQRLESQIDNWDMQAKRQRRQRRIYWTTAIAAALITAVLLLPPKAHRQPHDTFTSPKEAAAATEKALTFLSAQMNKGLEPMENIDRKIEQINLIINQQIMK
ncbi:MAG: hypothetical protein LBH04_11135 [Tannerellaceae bacterium]|jgi:hypothetical protein|nr:hypothetical protein [Tannerellaceae bacterium]